MEKHKQKPNVDRLSADVLNLLKSKGYRSGTLDNYRRILSRLSVFMKRKGFTEYSENVGELFLSEYLVQNASSIQHQRQIRTILWRLNELKNGAEFKLTKSPPATLPPSQFAELLRTYLESCASIGNKENTIAGKRRFCRDFLCHLDAMGCNNVFDINATYICQAILKLGNKDSYATIRSFLFYLYDTGAISHDLSKIIPKYRRRITLPTTYTDDEINRLEEVIDRTTRTGKRNYVIFLLASRLGMRSGDIAEMTLDNISFNRNSIDFIQNKTDQPLSLPLLPEIREAVLDYIQNARPDVESKHLFIREKAPFERISTAVIRQMLTECFKTAIIDISNKKHGPHTLRSSMASSMVNNDVPYEVVRKALGHIDPQAIKHYAKVDIENLRSYAIDVPTPTGVFAMILQEGERL